MNKIQNAISEIQNLEQLAERDQWVNKIHPLVKLVLTLAYILTVLSFPKYDLIRLAGMGVYLIAVFLSAELSFWDSLRRLRLILPFVCLIGVCNPIFDRRILLIDGMKINAGFISMITLILKGAFSALASYLLIATTGIDRICCALRRLHVPGAVVTQFMLTWRYLTLLLTEADHIMQAYSLRAPGQKGVHFKAWGTLAGRLLLRSLARANDVYDSMLLRGCQSGNLTVQEKQPLSRRDIFYLLFWAGLFVLLRRYPVIWIIGNFIGGLFV